MHAVVLCVPQVGLPPVYVNLMYCAIPLCLSSASWLAQRQSRIIGRVQVRLGWGWGGRGAAIVCRQARHHQPVAGIAARKGRETLGGVCAQVPRVRGATGARQMGEESGVGVGLGGPVSGCQPGAA